MRSHAHHLRRQNPCRRDRLLEGNDRQVGKEQPSLTGHQNDLGRPDGQRAVFGNRVIATTSEVQPDFAKIAEACQCHGEKVVEPAGVRPALERALAANTRGVPAVIDFLVAKERVAGSVDFFAKRWLPAPGNLI